MATTTERFGFTLPAGVDPVSVVVLNLNTQNIERYLGNTQDMIAPMYDETEGTYAVDDVVLYDNGLYKCLEDIDTPEVWDETKWEQTYAILSGGGGGTANVEPNPQGTPTDTLNTIGIDGTIYEIKGGGGSGGGDAYEETTLWEGSETPTGSSGIDLTLENDINNYDLILVHVDADSNEGCAIYPVSSISDGEDKLSCIYGAGNSSVNTWIALTSSSVLNVKKAISNVAVTYTKIVGVKFKGDSGGDSSNYYGAFIDTDNLIYTTVSSTGTDSYTATEDCYIMLDIVNGGGRVSTVQIDGETVSEYFLQGSTVLVPYNGYLKKGQTITVTHGQTASHTINVYGVTYSSSSSGGASTADAVTYDNTDSGLTADNVQDAIDELLARIEALENQ